MNITNSITALLSICGRKKSDLLDVLKVKTRQALSNKFTGNHWSAADLVKVADYAGAKLAFILPSGERLVIGEYNQAGSTPVGKDGPAPSD